MEPPRPPAGDDYKNTHDTTFEQPKMKAGEPKKNVVDTTPKEPIKEPVVQK